MTCHILLSIRQSPLTLKWRKNRVTCEEMWAILPRARQTIGKRSPFHWVLKTRVHPPVSRMRREKTMTQSAGTQGQLRGKVHHVWLSVTHGPQPTRLLCPWDSPGKSTGGGCHSLLQGIVRMQGSNPGFLHCRPILYCLSHQGSPIKGDIHPWVGSDHQPFG